MKPLDGQTLKQRIAGRPLEPDTIAELGIQRADALAAAHVKGIIRRDIKTTNVIVTDRDQVKILDFGLAKLQQGQEPRTDAEAPTATRHLDLTSQGSVVGTVAYMSPEQALGKEVDARSDIFSLGVVLYEMATGRQPFSGIASAALFDAILNRALTAPVELNPRVPLELGSIIFTSDRAGNENLWEIDVVSSALRQLTTGPGSEYHPAVSRDGRIAYSLFSHQQDLYVVSLVDGSHERQTSHTRNNTNARISPDDRKIVYDSSRTGNPEIWVIDRATGNETRLTNHPASDNFSGWSPDGREIVFISDRDGYATLWTVNADGSGGQPRLTGESVWLRTNGVLDYSAVRWSSDGAAIGFLAPSDRGPALYELDLATGSVTPKIYGVETFGWYRDRNRVIYTPIARDAAGRMEMRVVDLWTGKEGVLLEEPHTELIVARDGTAVAYCRAASHLTMQLYYRKLRPRERTDGLPTPVGHPVQLTDGYGKYHVHNGGWSADGKQIVYTRDVDAGNIYVIEQHGR